MSEIPVDQIPAMIFIKDLEGRYIYASPEALSFWGITEVEMIGKTDLELWGEEEKEYVEIYRANDLIVIETGKPLLGLLEGGVRKKGKALLNILINKAPFRDASGKIIGVIGAFILQDHW